MSFQDIAQKIIDRSIKSAIFIDDNIAIPFKEDDRTSSYHKTCAEIFESFDKNNTLVKFYKYTGSKQWEVDKLRLFHSRDLLILDWKLRNTEPRYFNALQILKEAVQIDNIFCIIIYTDTPQREHSSIYHNICCYFSNLDKNTSEFKPQIEEKIEEFGLDNKFINDSLGELINLVIDPHHAGEIFKKIRNRYMEILGENFSSFESFLESLLGITEKMEIYKILGYIVNECTFPTEFQNNIDIEIHTKKENRYLIINNTYIFIDEKLEIRYLYSKIKDAIVSSSDNFLPIMSLEMRNAFNDSSAIITKKLSSIDEHAFLHHQDKIYPKEAFFEFLKDLWKDQSFHFLLFDDKIKIFNELNSYMKERKITKESIKKKISSGELDNDLAKLNCFYNILLSNKKSRKIRFGDIFRLTENNNKTDRYLLCITAYCDCLYPENIKNNFYFVEGNKNNIAKGLDEGDEGFNTFIEEESDKELICIKWKDKPITIHVPDNNNNINLDISVNISAKQYTAQYKATLKENYTQRMANKAFTYPLRVGIFFADKKKKMKNKIINGSI